MISALNLLKDTNAQTDVVCLSALSELSDFVIQNVKTSDLQNDAGFLSSCYPRNDVTYDASISGFWIQPNKVNVIQVPAGLPENDIVSCNGILSAYSEENDYQIVVVTPEKTCIDLKMLVEQNDEVVEDELVTPYFGKLSPNQPYLMSVHKGDVCVNQSYGMQQRIINVLDIHEYIGASKYGRDYSTNVKTGWIFALDNVTNVVSIDLDTNYTSYKIVIPQFTATAAVRRLRRFSVGFVGDLQGTNVLINIPFTDVDGQMIIYKLAEGSKWTDIYMIRKNFIYEFTEIAEHVFTISAKEEINNDYGIMIDIPLLKWNTQPLEPFEFNNNTLELMYAIFVEGVDSDDNWSPSPGTAIREIIHNYIFPTSYINSDRWCHQNFTLVNGCSGVPTTFQDFFEFLLMSAFPQSNYFKRTDNVHTLLKYLVETAEYELVVSQSGIIYIRLKLKGQQAITFPHDFIAMLEMSTAFLYMQSGEIQYTTMSKTNVDNIKIQKYSDNIEDSQTVYLLPEVLSSNPSILENSPAMFYSYDNELSSYKPTFLYPEPSSTTEMCQRYKQLITFYSGTKIGVFGNELSVFTGPEVRAMIQQMVQQQNS